MLDVNNRLNGAIENEYNQLCNVKHVLDLEIVDYYYKGPEQLLNTSISSGKTELAREAYPLFVKSQKGGSEEFYDDLDKKRSLFIQYDTIYVDAPYNLDINNRFLNS